MDGARVARAGGNDEQVQRLLSYPIAISMNVTGDNPSSDAPRVHPPPADSDRRRRRRWVRRTSSPTPAADASNFPAGGPPRFGPLEAGPTGGRWLLQHPRRCFQFGCWL